MNVGYERGQRQIQTPLFSFFCESFNNKLMIHGSLKEQKLFSFFHWVQKLMFLFRTEAGREKWTKAKKKHYVEEER